MNKSVKNYFAAVPAERIAKIEQLHQLIVQLFPSAVVGMTYKMPTYCLDDGWVAVANQKQYVSLYTCSAEYLEKLPLRQNP